MEILDLPPVVETEPLHAADLNWGPFTLEPDEPTTWPVSCRALDLLVTDVVRLEQQQIRDRQDLDAYQCMLGRVFEAFDEIRRQRNETRAELARVNDQYRALCASLALKVGAHAGR